MTIMKQIKSILFDYVSGLISLVVFSPLILISIAILSFLARICWWVIVAVWSIL